MDKNKPKLNTYLLVRVGLYQKYNELSKKTKPTRKQEIYKQKLELLTYRDDFQEEVKFLRKSFDIPQYGFPDFKSSLEWTKKQTDTKAFIKKDPIRAYAKLRELNSILPETEYQNAVKGFLRSFEINDRWFGAVEYYLLFNNIEAHEVLPKSVEIRIDTDEITGKSSLWLKVSSDTEQRDIRDEWWRVIETFQGIMRSQQDLDFNADSSELAKSLEEIDPVPSVKEQKRKKNRKSDEVVLEKQKTAYALRKQGKSYKEIASEIGCMYNEVGTYIKRFENAINNVKLD